MGSRTAAPIPRRSARAAAPHSLRTTAEGAYTSAVDVLAFLHKRNCTIDEDTLYCAAEFASSLPEIHDRAGARVSRRQLARAQDAQGYDNNIMAVSAKNGHLGVLYLYDVGCDFAPKTLECIGKR